MRIVRRSRKTRVQFLAVANGLLHLPSNELHPHTPEYFNLTASAVAYDPNAAVPANWNKFLDQVWPGDKQSKDTLHEIFGYLLIADTFQQEDLLVDWRAATREKTNAARAHPVGGQGIGGRDLYGRPQVPIRASTLDPASRWPRYPMPRLGRPRPSRSGCSRSAAATPKASSANTRATGTGAWLCGFSCRPMNCLPSRTRRAPSALGSLSLNLQTHSWARRSPPHRQALAGTVRRLEFSHRRVQTAQGALSLHPTRQRQGAADQLKRTDIKAFIRRKCRKFDPDYEVTTDIIYANYRNWCTANGCHPVESQFGGC